MENYRYYRTKKMLRDLLKDIINERRKTLLKDTQACDGEPSKEGMKGKLGNETCAEGINKSKQKDLLTHLIRSNELENKNGTESMNDDGLIDLLFSMVIGGYDTTSIALMYTIYCITTRPDMEEAMIEEIKRVLGSYSSASSYDNTIRSFDIDKLVLCKAVILEAIRLYSPGYQTARTSDKVVELESGIKIPKGVHIRVGIWPIHRNDDVFPRATEYLPERWVRQKKDTGEWVERFPGEEEEDEKNEKKNHEEEKLPFRLMDNQEVPAADRNSFLAFSGGARSCVGKNFSLQESVTILSILMRALKFEIKDGYKVNPQREGVLQVPKDKMPMWISQRRNT